MLIHRAFMVIYELRNFHGSRMDTLYHRKFMGIVIHEYSIKFIGKYSQVLILKLSIQTEGPYEPGPTVDHQVIDDACWRA